MAGKGMGVVSPPISPCFLLNLSCGVVYVDSETEDVPLINETTPQTSRPRRPVYSHSRLGVFKNCPKQYEFQYITGPKRRLTTVENFLGTRFHAVMEKLYGDVQMCGIPGKDELLSLFSKSWDAEWTPEIKIVKPEYGAEDFKNRGLKAVSDYYRSFYPFNQDQTLGIERRISITLDGAGEYLLTGFIDRLAKTPDGTVEIHDYKTSNSLPSQDDVDQDRQLAFYEIGVRQTFPQIVDRMRLVWHYVVFNQTIVSTRSSEALDTVKKETVGLIDEIEATKTFETRESFLCNYCAYYDLCPAKKHEVQIAELEKTGADVSCDDGVKLVDRYVAAQTREQEAKREKDELRTPIVDFAKAGNFERIVGTTHALKIAIENKLKLPSSEDAQARELIRQRLHDLGLLGQFSAVDFRALERALSSGDLQAKLTEFLKSEESVRITASKRKEKEERGEDD
ncbi:MAG: PD-(D/E)XK nuclease family protein [Pseudomonadota bacterium]